MRTRLLFGLGMILVMVLGFYVPTTSATPESYETNFDFNSLLGANNGYQPMVASSSVSANQWRSTVNSFDSSLYDYQVVKPEFDFSIQSLGLAQEVPREEVPVPPSILAISGCELDHLPDTQAVLQELGYNVDIFFTESATPTLKTLLLYDIVFFYGQCTPLDANALGDVFADYLDAGGKMIASAFAALDYVTALGRFVDYMPFEIVSSYSQRTYTGGSSSHPLMAGLEDLFNWADDTQIVEGAELLSTWDDETPFLATLGSVVGINALPPPVYWDGNLEVVWDNVIKHLMGLEDEPEPRDPQAQIEILSNDDLTRFPGSGTHDDPYIIEGLTEWKSTLDLIHIKNTDAYVEVRENSFEVKLAKNAAEQTKETCDQKGACDDDSSSDLTGLFINNATNIKVLNNTFEDLGVGVFVNDSSSISVEENLIIHNSLLGAVFSYVVSFDLVDNKIGYNGDGAVVLHSTDGDIRENDITRNIGFGLALDRSHGNKLVLNSFLLNGEEGLIFIDSHRNLVFRNQIKSNGFTPRPREDTKEAVATNSLGTLAIVDNTLVINANFAGSGFFLDPSVNNTIAENDFSGNAGIGTYVQESDNNSFDGNNFTDNGLNGMFFENSSSNTFTNNAVTGNGFGSAGLQKMGLSPMQFVTFAAFAGSGFFLDPSNENILSGNDFSGNYANGLILELSDGNEISNNNVTSNGLTGLFFVDSHGNDITGNDFSSNGDLGVELVEQAFATNQLSFYEYKLMASFAGSGFFLDPSFNNTVSDNSFSSNAGNGLMLLGSDMNTISENAVVGNGADGVSLINSSHNSIDGNSIAQNGYGTQEVLVDVEVNSLKLLASFAGSGFFLDPSENNSFTGNTVESNAASGVYFLESNSSLVYDNTISSNGYHGIFFEDSSHNNVSFNRIEENGFEAPTDDGQVGLVSNANFAGSGFFLDPSHFNYLGFNNFTGNAGVGLYSESSTNSQVRHNRFLNHPTFGVFLDDLTSGFSVAENNFEGNNEGDSQASDDGDENSFGTNFWADHDNTDKNLDGIADNPYPLAGDAENVDATSSNIANGLNFYEPFIWSVPRVLNLGSHGHYFKVKVYLDDGYRALDLDWTKFTLNDTVTAHWGYIARIQKIVLYFDRQEVQDMIKDLYESRDWSLKWKSKVTLELHGLMNDDLLDLTATDRIWVYEKHKHRHKWHKHWGWGGFVAVIPFRRKFKNDLSKLSK